MTSIVIKGIRTHVARGKTYRYHRKTRVRIDIDPEAFPAEFLARVQELDRLGEGIPSPLTHKRRGEALGDMFDAWVASEEWAALKPQTRYSYERAIAAETGSLARLRARRITEFSPPFVIAIRDAIRKTKKRWMANYSVKVLRVAFGWGRLHGWCETNPAQGVPLLPRPADAPKRNRMWSAEEFAVVSEHASPRVRRAIALAYYAGLRVGDIIAVPWTGWDGEILTWQQSKTGHVVQVRVPTTLRDELNSGAREGVQILTNGDGQPYTRDGLQTLLWKLVKRLVAEGLVKPGLCFHGMRHSLGAALYDLGLDREARKAALGHTSDAASAVYERDGNQLAASDRAFIALDRHLAATTPAARTDQKQESVKPAVNNAVNIVPFRNKRSLTH